MITSGATKKGTSKGCHKNFLSEAQKRQIMDLAKAGMKNGEIAKMFSTNSRQIATYLRQQKNGMVNKFTEEEDRLLIYHYTHTSIKEAEIKRYFPRKTAWMIRNRISLLKRKNKLSDVILPTVEIQPKDNPHEEIETTDDVFQEKVKSDIIFDLDTSLLINDDEMFYDYSQGMQQEEEYGDSMFNFFVED